MFKITTRWTRGLIVVGVAATAAVFSAVAVADPITVTQFVYGTTGVTTSVSVRMGLGAQVFDTAVTGLTITFTGDTTDVVPFSMGGAQGFLLSKGSATLRIDDFTHGTSYSATINPGQMVVGVDVNHGGIGIGSIIDPIYPYGLLVGANLSDPTYDLQHSFSLTFGNAFGISCVGFVNGPPCLNSSPNGPKYPIHTDQGDFWVEAQGITNASISATVTPTATVGRTAFYGVGFLNPSAPFSEIRDATMAGGTIIAIGSSSHNAASMKTEGDTAIRWTSSGGLVELPAVIPNSTPINFVTASAITRNGQDIAARARDSATGPDVVAVLVTTDGTINQPLGFLSGAAASSSPYSAATSLTEDAKVVYGFSRYNTGNIQSFRWTAATGMVALGLMAGDVGSYPAPRSVSRNGSVVVGTDSSPTAVAPGANGPGSRAFVYVHGSGVNALPMLSGGSWSAALALTPDGQHALGSGDSTAFPKGELIRWNLATGTVRPWGSPDATLSPNNLGGMTADSQVGVVEFESATTSISYIRNAHGWFTVDRCLTDAGIDLTGWVLNFVLGVSADGTLLFGSGHHGANVEGWVAKVPRGYLHHDRGKLLLDVTP